MVDEEFTESSEQYWWNDSQSIEDDSVNIRKIKRDNNYGYSSINVIEQLNVNKIHDNNDNQILYDSGAQQSLVPISFVPKLTNKFKYDKDSPPSIRLFDACNHPISLAGSGRC